jgi:hypothetical protein
MRYHPLVEPKAAPPAVSVSDQVIPGPLLWQARMKPLLGWAWMKSLVE